MNQLFFLFSVLLLLLSAPTTAQSPAAAPAPAGPTNVTAVLEKASQFTTFIRLLLNSKVADQINTELNTSTQGLTVFAPTDNAFSALKPGTLNSFTDQQKVELMQFHVLPSFFSASQFQTASNPIRTQAGGSQGSFLMNVTASGSQVNITTGLTNATVANTVYSDGQLAVYQVDQVLLPVMAPAPAPPPPESEKGGRSADSPSESASSTDSSDAGCVWGNAVGVMAGVMLALAAAF